jgi:signal transduction histidine kinase
MTYRFIEPDRIFTLDNELVYTSAFTNSIMAEVRRVDVELAEKAKTNLVNSITHELRNPLHGILGTADILSDTAMNALQHGMVHTVESCGRTLLDTINSLLDLTFIDQYRKGDASQIGKLGKKQGLPQSLFLGGKSSIPDVELDAVLEEVTDCVFAGYCFYNHPQAPPPAPTGSSSRSAGQTAEAAGPAGPRPSQVTVIFDIDPDAEWNFYTHAGAWRRILMNVFGNSLKYTRSGLSTWG